MTRCIASVGFLFLLTSVILSQDLSSDVWHLEYDRQEFANFKFHNPSCLSCSLEDTIQSVVYQDDEHIWLISSADSGNTKAYCLNFMDRTKWFLGNGISMIAAFDADSRSNSSFSIVDQDELVVIRNGKEADRIQLPVVPDQLVLFSPSSYGILTSQGRLEIYESKTGDRKVIAENVSMLRKGGVGQILYMQTMPSQTIFIKSYDIVTSSVKIVGEVNPEIRSFTRLDDGSILGIRESQILLFHPQKQPVWKVIGDLSLYGIQRIRDIQSGQQKSLLLTVINN